MAKLETENISPELLLFDPNNYRFQDSDGFVYAAEERYHELTVQTRTYQRLRKEDGMLELKKSIIRNGFIPIEQIVVRPYKYVENKYLVIEGNRRLTAVRWILEDNDSGVIIPENIISTITKLPTIVLKEEVPDEVFRASLMGIRHVSSVKQWGGYQRAKLIADMRDKQNLELGEASERLGLSSQEVNRRYRAYKALEQMQKNEDVSEFAKPALYPVFHEAISIPTVRQWLDWNDTEYCFKDSDTLRIFYDLLTPTSIEDGQTKEPKITTYIQVRELREILERSEAKRILLDPSRSFMDASIIVQQEKLSHLWAEDVSASIRSLEAMGVQELKNLHKEDIELLEKLGALIKERLKDRQSLSKKKTK